MILSDRFERAVVYAVRHHNSQQRKGTGIPYISHLLCVSGIALEYGADEDEAIAALLHDAIEDPNGRPVQEVRGDIRELFGDRVLEIVEGCTDTDVTPKPPWRQRKEAYIAHLKNASPSVRLVSASDKLQNAQCILKDYRDVGEQLWGRFTGGREGTLWYYRALVSEFRTGHMNPICDELDRVVAELERLTAR